MQKHNIINHIRNSHPNENQELEELLVVDTQSLKRAEALQNNLRNSKMCKSSGHSHLPAKIENVVPEMKKEIAEISKFQNSERSCPYCKYSTKNLSNLSRHIMGIHEKDPPYRKGLRLVI